MTGYFDHALAFFGKKEATLALYVNRKRVDSAVINTFELPLEGYELATTLGQNRSGGGAVFEVFLGRPDYFERNAVGGRVRRMLGWVAVSPALRAADCERVVAGAF